jgi:ribonuclease HI
MSDIRIYTDGGCSGNPGPGAWAYIILRGSDRWSASEAAAETTNNRMELSAVIAALQQVAGRPEWASSSLEIYTDSEYVQKGITKWIRAWEANGWRTSNKQPVKNQDLWKRLRQLSSAHPVQWHWLAGHAGHPLNEECDRLVRQTISRQKT